ncbi:hypothetical protein CC_2475 [Caulobacter vibrioides CB15]|uniref:Uncharacterized protein n=1 Tax=Caulobacter vibrioides (strain ATCC 19089 / CIP 103742 / CB 15) TaxID=190650 RepID=Q9A5H2_CAUVC|nr:hypothetical protein CC_2475 [Caulobacter vibrioides CB15]
MADHGVAATRSPSGPPRGRRRPAPSSASDEARADEITVRADAHAAEVLARSDADADRAGRGGQGHAIATGGGEDAEARLEAAVVAARVPDLDLAVGAGEGPALATLVTARDNQLSRPRGVDAIGLAAEAVDRARGDQARTAQIAGELGGRTRLGVVGRNIGAGSPATVDEDLRPGGAVIAHDVGRSARRRRTTDLASTARTARTARTALGPGLRRHEAGHRRQRAEGNGQPATNRLAHRGAPPC